MNELIVKSEKTSLMLEPTNIMEAEQLAERLAKSTIIPRNFQNKPNDIYVAMMWSRNLGLPIVQGLQSIAVINGTPSVWGDAQLGICLASGLLESMKETIIGQGDQMTAHCVVTRKGQAEPFSWSFSVFEAKQAGLWGKQGPWRQYPKRMLALRARSVALRNAFADLLKGLITAEELRDSVSNETKAPVQQHQEEVIIKAAPKQPIRKSEQQPIEDVEEVKPAQIEAQQSPFDEEQQTPQEGGDLFGDTEPQAAPQETITVEEVQERLDQCSDMKQLIDLYNSLPTEVKLQVKDMFASRRQALGV